MGQIDVTFAPIIARGGIRFTFKYYPPLVNAIKQIPGIFRSYEPDTYSWVISPDYAMGLSTYMSSDSISMLGRAIQTIQSITSQWKDVQRKEMVQMYQCKVYDQMGLAGAYGSGIDPITNDTNPFLYFFPVDTVWTWFEGLKTRPKFTPVMNADDPFVLLGVPKNVSDEDLTIAFRIAARASHPDVGGNKEDFIKVKAAYDKLKNPLYRKRLAAAEKMATMVDQPVVGVKKKAPTIVYNPPVPYGIISTISTRCPSGFLVDAITDWSFT